MVTIRTSIEAITEGGTIVLLKKHHVDTMVALYEAGQKVQAIKFLREEVRPTLSLRDAKDICDALPNYFPTFRTYITEGDSE